MATTDRRQPASLTFESVDLGGGVRATLDGSGAAISLAHVPTGQNHIVFQPKTRQEANRMSIALKKASRRLQAVGATLPEEGGR